VLEGVQIIVSKNNGLFKVQFQSFVIDLY